MHSLSCYFLLHHHFEALTTSSDSISISSGSSNDDDDDEMSDESDIEHEPSSLDTSIQIPPNETIELERENTRSDSTINPVEEENQFIYDDEMNRLLCVGTTFSDIPQSIIDTYSLKTKVKTILLFVDIRYISRSIYLDS